MIDATQLLVIKQKFYFLKQVFCLKKAKNLRGIVSARQRSYLAKLLDCPEKEAVDKLFSIEVS